MIRYSNISKFSRSRSNFMIKEDDDQHVQVKEPKLELSEQSWISAFNYLEPKLEVDGEDEGNTFVTQQSLDSSQLQWEGASEEQLAFMRKVYDINYQRYSSRRGKQYDDIPEDELESVLGSYKLRKEAAPHFKNLLEAVKKAIEDEGVNVKVRLNSAYRSPAKQFRLWQDYFPGYYNRTKKTRDEMEGGPHGQKAADYLGGFIRTKISTPGFSNHNDGMAVDLHNTENGSYINNKTTKTWIDKWKASWLWDWMTKHANTYKFYQETSINEPWHWVYRA